MFALQPTIYPHIDKKLASPIVKLNAIFRFAHFKISETMIMAGKNITAKDDPLQKIKVEYLYHKLIRPEAEIEAKIRQLRIVRQLDLRQYSVLKRQLPYIVCGIFNPAYRRTENFGYTEYFIIDIDHVSEKELSLPELRKRLANDNRVVLCFLSPGEDGLKVMFRLKQRCYDAGIYSIFYKYFVLQFAKQYALEQVVDARTSDVARACFESFDAEAYYNPQAECIDMDNFINENDTGELFRIKKEVEKAVTVPAKKTEEVSERAPDEATLLQIKSLLLPGARPRLAKREAFVPEELNQLMEKLIPFIEQAGLTIIAIDNINYGKKLKMKAGIREAEINIFYGKKGYSVVISPRRGTNDELNKLTAQLIEQYIYS